MKLLIKNANIVSSTDVFKGDLLIEGEFVSRIDKSIDIDGVETIDASGQYLLPGGVDVHTHFDLQTALARTSDDFFSGTVAAAYGGTTTVVDHLAFGPSGCRLGHQIEVYHGLAEDSVIDYGFHGVIQHVYEGMLKDMEILLEEGISSYKIYLTYDFKLSDDEVLQILAKAKELGIIICAHCESDALIDFLTRRLLLSGCWTPVHYPGSRPVTVEAESVDRFLRFAQALGNAPVYIVHMSSKEALEIFKLARMQGQKNIFAETCPQYLWLDDSKYKDDVKGLKYVMNPPLRSKEDQEALWQGLQKGDLDVIATDHCPFFFEQKKSGIGNFTHCPSGAPGVELRMSLLFSQALTEKKLSLPEVVNLCCKRPAEIFGFYPRKGELKPGADADMVLFDPNVEKIIEKSQLHENVDYTPYEGIKIKGTPVMTISRGEVIVKDGVFTGRKGRGRFIKRHKSALIESTC